MGRCGRAHFWAPIVGNNDVRQCTDDDVMVVIGFAVWGGVLRRVRWQRCPNVKIVTAVSIGADVS
ncbi:hypothetical protein CIP107561_00592 [Corynebacterium diphtheriae]|nr:hypothetical protein CIP107561_00592 [Corynebacterium diphtheriae]